MPQNNKIDASKSFNFFFSGNSDALLVDWTNSFKSAADLFELFAVLPTAPIPILPPRPPKPTPMPLSCGSVKENAITNPLIPIPINAVRKHKFPQALSAESAFSISSSIKKGANYP